MKPAEEYILKQPEPFKSILLHVQLLIEHALPEVHMEFKWRIPCYYQSRDYVDVAFWHSAHLSSNLDKYLVSEKRKVIKSLRYKILEDINDEIFIRILKEVESFKNKSFLK